MHYPDQPFIPGQSYAFLYPNLEEGVDLRRMTFECLANRAGRILVVGLDLNTGNENRWLPELMIDPEPYEPVLIPQRTYDVEHEGRSIRLFVFSVVPEVGGDDFRVTGRVDGRFFAAWLSELAIKTADRGQPQSNNLNPTCLIRTEASGKP